MTRHDEKQVEGAQVVSVRYIDDREWEKTSMKIQGFKFIIASA